MNKYFIKTALVLYLMSQPLAFAQNRSLTIIRHGQGEHNIKHFYSSNPKHANYKVANLTPLGKQQAAYTGLKLKIQGFSRENIKKVVVSPLPRTLQTAEVMSDLGLFEKNQIQIDPRVIEIQAGSLEGEHYNPKTLDWNNPTPGIQDAESRQQLRCRMQSFYNDLIKNNPTGNILVITHGSPSMQLIHLLTGENIKLNTADSVSIPITHTVLRVEDCGTKDGEV